MAQIFFFLLYSLPTCSLDALNIILCKVLHLWMMMVVVVGRLYPSQMLDRILWFVDFGWPPKFARIHSWQNEIRVATKKPQER